MKFINRVLIVFTGLLLIILIISGIIGRLAA